MPRQEPLSRARLGRKRKAQRQILASVKRRTRGGLDSYCVAGGGSAHGRLPDKRALRKLAQAM